MVIFTNRMRFDQSKYGKESIIKESVLLEKPMDPYQNKVHNLVFERGSLALQDLTMDLDSLTLWES